MPITFHDSTEAEIEAFADACERLAGFDERISPEWADGYLTALAGGPRAVPADEWLPRLCGEAFERCFADPDDAVRARAALGARARVLAVQLDPERLLEEPDALHLSPLMSNWTDETRAQAVAEGWIDAEGAQALVTGADWCCGFAAALVDFDAEWTLSGDDEGSEELRELMQHIVVLSHAEGSAELAQHVQTFYADALPTRDDLVDQACIAVQDLRVWWLDHAPRPPTRHVAATPGRNDPCPCGSGRKFKKCHGATG